MWKYHHCAVILISLLCCFSLPAQQVTKDKVWNPKDYGKGYVSNADKIISQETEVKLNGLLSKLDQDKKAQVAVVLLNSIGDAVPKTFAHALFNQWSIGDKQTHNGLLILLVKDQRRIEFEVGYGLEGLFPDIICYRIQQKAMVPALKQNHYDQALLDGLQLISDRLYASKEKLAIQGNQLAEGRSTYPLSVFFYDFLVSLGYLIIITSFTVSAFGQRLISTSCWWGILLFMAPVLIITLLAIFTNIFMTWEIFLAVFYGCWCITTSLFFTIELNIRKNGYFKRRPEQYRKIRTELRDLRIYTILFPFPLLIFQFIRWKMWLKHLRYDPYYSEKCKADMILLTGDKSTHLSAAELVEERLGAVEYDIWIVPECSDQLKFAYPDPTSKIVKCNTCKNKTAKLRSRKTILRATSKREGRRELDYECQFCRIKFCRGEAIPKRQIFFKVNNVGSATSAGSSSSLGSSSGSSSGSWGGGSSGGGGAGSNW